MSSNPSQVHYQMRVVACRTFVPLTFLASPVPLHHFVLVWLRNPHFCSMPVTLEQSHCGQTQRRGSKIRASCAHTVPILYCLSSEFTTSARGLRCSLKYSLTYTSPFPPGMFQKSPSKGREQFSERAENVTQGEEARSDPAKWTAVDGFKR